MKSLKEYFNMVVTAVICLAMSLIPGKNRGKVVKVLTAGGTFYGKRFSNKHVVMERIPGCVSANQVLEKSILSNMGRNSSYDTGIKIQRMTEKELFRKRKIRADTHPRHVSLPSVGPGDRKIILFPSVLYEEKVYSVPK